MEELLSGVNWMAVVVGWVAAYLLGWLWFSPAVFGKKWAAAHGMEVKPARKRPVPAVITSIVGLFLMSWFVGVSAVSSTLATALLALFAFALMFDSSQITLGTPTVGRVISLGYWIVAFVVMIIAQGIF